MRRSDVKETVDRLDVSVYVLPLDEPESDGTFTWTQTTVVVVEARCGDIAGVGYTYGPRACALVVRDVLASAVVGVDVTDVGRAWREMVVAVRNVGRPGIASMAIAAVDVALWDLKARMLGVPLCALLGRLHDDVAIYGSGGFTSMTEHDLCEQLTGWVEEGIGRVKMKVGTAWGSSPTRDLDRVRAVRRAIGDGVELFVDANGAYTRKQAVRLASQFVDEGATWFEEPVSSDDLDGLCELRETIDLDVAAGEYGYDLAYFERMCAAGAVDVLQADVTRCAGITEWRRVAAVAAAHGLDVSAHCAPALHLAVAAATPNVRHLEWFADHVRAVAVLFDGAPGQRGGVVAPEVATDGNGLRLKRRDAEPYLVASSA